MMLLFSLLWLKIKIKWTHCWLSFFFFSTMFLNSGKHPPVWLLFLLGVHHSIFFFPHSFENTNSNKWCNLFVLSWTEKTNSAKRLENYTKMGWNVFGGLQLRNRSSLIQSLHESQKVVARVITHCALLGFSYKVAILIFIHTTDDVTLQVLNWPKL